jgi:hypothetical protein
MAQYNSRRFPARGAAEGRGRAQNKLDISDEFNECIMSLKGHENKVHAGLGRVVALHHRVYTGFANVFGGSVSEATMRPNPRSGLC